jgi:hypothetical protein
MATRDRRTGPGRKRTPLGPEQIAEATARLVPSVRMASCLDADEGSMRWRPPVEIDGAAYIMRTREFVLALV